MQTFKKIFYLLTLKERKEVILLLIMISIMAFLDMIGVASILPFMAVLSNPEIIEANIILSKMFMFFKIFGVENKQQFLFALGILVFVLLVISLTFKAFTAYAQVRFSQMRQYSISKRLVEGYLNQPYGWFLNKHSADLGKNVLSEVGQVVAGGITPLITLITNIIVAAALIGLLVLVDPKLAFVAAFSLSLAYIIIYKFVRKYLDKIGKERFFNNQMRFTAISDAFGAAKEIKVSGLEQTYIKRFSAPAQIFAHNQASATIIRQLPRYALEAIAFGGVILMILYLILKSGSFNNALPIISLYVFAGYRLMPALQQIYGSYTQLTFVGPSLDALSYDLKNLTSFKSNNDQSIMLLDKTIVLKNICYNYPNASRTALKDINLNISAKTTVGLVGATGSGKTTTVDIILGLLEAQKGTLEVDGQIISKKNLRTWQRSIGYVPQQIYLADDTVAANIAFGKDPKDIDQERIEKVSKIANLHNFVVNELPIKYQTTIGERGIRLSGGQKQRIGIARALYHNPQVLVLDEATSALDNETEQVVMEAINNIRKNITIILIAHRLNTVKNCDIIFKIDKGRIVNKGTYSELFKKDNV